LPAWYTRVPCTTLFRSAAMHGNLLVEGMGDRGGHVADPDRLGTGIGAPDHHHRKPSLKRRETLDRRIAATEDDRRSEHGPLQVVDRKSTRLNSSHVKIS